MAARARTEIDAVFVELNAAVDASTRGRARIALTSMPFHDDKVSRSIALSGDDMPTALAVFKTSGDPPARRQIARWRASPHGFPCTLIWDDRHVMCGDAEALRDELVDLMRTPAVGFAIKAIVGTE
ncbi:hypothetical protein [Mitsuaria sp. GD03876]|uniref:hypothetical protein n=1 Tax=Mitsuaria sp. GD03876 TaxID=2975399 RepID=UPI00244CB3E7|nr:hypothetical protein [Mitsuaria sp. GD03876]MDH0864487.1 hypothetical protein [Mitsuaria sp. GD03876]